MSQETDDKSPQERFTAVVVGVSNKLQPAGFKKRALSLEKVDTDTKLIINFQKSAKSASDKIVFTINIGIVVAKLLDDGSLASASIWDAHYRERIGRFLSQPHDKWWEISEHSDVSSLVDEFGEVLLPLALAQIVPYADIAKLGRLWRTGASPGLTDLQRTRNLQRLQTVF